jgi:hypothetical protein
LHQRCCNIKIKANGVFEFILEENHTQDQSISKEPILIKEAKCLVDAVLKFRDKMGYPEVSYFKESDEFSVVWFKKDIEDKSLGLTYKIYS